MGTHLHRCRTTPILPHLSQHRLQIQSFWSRLFRWLNPPAYIIPDRPKITTTQPTTLKQRLHKQSRGGLSIRPRQTQHTQLFGWVSIKISRHPSQGSPSALHPDSWNVRFFRFLLRHYSHCAALKRIRYIRVPITFSPLPCTKNGTLSYLLGFVRQARHICLLASLPLLHLNSFHDIRQLHGEDRRATTAPRFKCNCSATWVAIFLKAGPATNPP